MDIKLLEALSNATGIGHIDEATAIARRELEMYAEVIPFGQTGLLAKIDKGADKALLLDAHIDEVGFIVTHILGDGFIKVTNVGGNDNRILPATPVTVHGAVDIPAVFASTPPHLADKKGETKSLDDSLLDTGLENAKDLISAGDLITYKKDFTPLLDNKVTGKALDDRAGVFCLLELSKRIYDKPLPYNVVICITEQEELGTRGAITAAFASEVDEAIALDVSFGDAPDVPSAKCGRLGEGAMLGISPVLSKKITDRLISIAKEKNIPHQLEVMGGKTGTDADVISVSKSGIPCGLISIPLRNMHTPCEVIDIRDLESVCDILEEYILSGGAAI